MRVALGIALVLLGACDRKPRQFTCYKTGTWRECAPKLARCADEGCFERDEAYCFPYLLTAIGKYPDTRATMCTPTLEECEAWHADRLQVENHPLGSCVRAKPDEYIDVKE